MAAAAKGHWFWLLFNIALRVAVTVTALINLAVMLVIKCNLVNPVVAPYEEHH